MLNVIIERFIGAADSGHLNCNSTPLDLASSCPCVNQYPDYRFSCNLNLIPSGHSGSKTY